MSRTRDSFGEALRSAADRADNSADLLLIPVRGFWWWVAGTPDYRQDSPPQLNDSMRISYIGGHLHGARNRANEMLETVPQARDWRDRIEQLLEDIRSYQSSVNEHNPS